MSDVTAEEDQGDDAGILQAGPSGATTQESNRLKRTASKAALNPPSSPATSRLLTTPKKRPYTGPIHDPNPINPFATSLLRRSAIKSDQQPPAVSPFVHASSPSKLKQLLEQNSLRKIQQRISPPNEITPRTKARKRLTGEMDETPVKARVRRKRGEGRGQSETAEKMADETVGGSGPQARPLDGEVGDGDDELGPTPVKVASFHSFFDAEGAASAGPSGNMMSRLQAASAKGKGKERAAADIAADVNVPLADKSPSANGSRSPAGLPIASPSPVVPLDELAAPTPPAISEEEESADPVASSSRQAAPRPDKILSISDDELDEWDPEAGHTRHRVKIVPTRSRPARRAWSDDDDDLDDVLDGAEDQDTSDGALYEETVPPLDDTTTSQTNPSVPSPPPPLLSLLSLTSPNQRQGRYAKLKELRYKALFNPNGSDAQRLRAFQKGQEAFLSGETDADDEEADLHALNHQDESAEVADDDWESESDGWKRTGVEMDDDAW